MGMWAKTLPQTGGKLAVCVYACSVRVCAHVTVCVICESEGGTLTLEMPWPWTSDPPQSAILCLFFILSISFPSLPGPLQLYGHSQIFKTWSQKAPVRKWDRERTGVLMSQQVTTVGSLGSFCWDHLGWYRAGVSKPVWKILGFAGHTVCCTTLPLSCESSHT